MSGPIEVVAPQLLRDGDTLILTFARPLSCEEIDGITGSLRGVIPESVQIGILDHCSGAVIYRPGEADQG